MLRMAPQDEVGLFLALENRARDINTVAYSVTGRSEISQSLPLKIEM
jgi:hypothetical protein